MMQLRTKIIKVKDSIKFDFHPLARELYDELMSAFGKNCTGYLETVDTMLANMHDQPLNMLYVINTRSNEYAIIGGCFTPMFNLGNILSENTLVFKLETSKGYDAEGKSDKSIEKIKKRIKKDFEQDIVNFIFLDFIKAISILAIKKPGAMDEGLQEITRKHSSQLWGLMFDEKSSYVRQTDLARLLNVDTDTIRNHGK